MQRMRWLNGSRLNRRDFEQTPGAGGGQGGLACSGPWGCKELDMTERIN